MITLETNLSSPIALSAMFLFNSKQHLVLNEPQFQFKIFQQDTISKR